MNKTSRYLLISLGVLVLLALIIRGVKGTSPKITLDKAAPLTGAVSQSLHASSGGTVPIAGKDYNLQNIHYFDSGIWAVASISPIKTGLGPATVILKKDKGMYSVIIGPGTAFPASILSSLPNELSQYLQDRRIIYGAN